MNKKELIKQIYKGNKFNFLFLLIASIFEATVFVIISIMLEKVMAIIETNELSELYKQGFIFLALLVLSIIIYFFLMHIKPKYKRKAISQYKNTIYNNLLKKNIENFNKNETSIYISALTNDVNYIEENYIFNIFEIITQLTLFIFSLVVMLLYSPTLTLVSVLLSLLPLIVMLLVGSKLSYHEKRISDVNGSFMHFLKDNLLGFSTIKVFKSENKINELFKNKNDSLEQTKAKKVGTTVLIEFLQTATSLIAQFGVFFIGAYLCIKKGSIQGSVIILFVQMMNSILGPLIQVPTLISKRRACIPLFEKIANIISENTNVDNKEKVSFENEINLKEIHYQIDDKVILDNINYKFEKNKAYAIVGTSGSGKTTLMNILSGKIQSYNGTVLYDELNTKNCSIDSLFEINSIVEQNVFVFDDTIKNNITMYSNFDNQVLNEIINKTGLSELIKEKGEDYKCGENGCNLSGGEKQRISIARALLKQSKIIMMDEATSALDQETSTIITNNILDLQDITKIIITHKLDEKILKRFDEIIVMKNGNIVETGDFDSLIERNGLFKSIYEIS